MLIIIDNYDSFTYNLYQVVAPHKDTRVFRNDKISVAEIKKLNPEGIILSPGPGRPENSGICLDIIKTLASEIPILGICLGHQAIGIAFGGNVIQHHEIVHGKSSKIHHNQTDLFTEVPNTFFAGRYHSLVIELSTLPAELMVTAISEDGTIMGVKHAHHLCYGIQFHPESILTPEGPCLLKNFLTLCQNNKVRNNHVNGIAQQAHAA
ncbi:MAG: aminodeoxychorismate/anthranilate synthase component II [Gammaproteobacteria bacterium RIFCSPHIGHO2_12_FULL_41_15]|nr:MAG: aminodeoxychorismate/anthranilate synthase component II [Gammaproteobacteria bacterium RIFCSPHIGHO2_12_FULL_41_15]